MNKTVFYYVFFLGIIFSFSYVQAADDYIGGVPVRNYYGQPVPDMFEISEQGFEAVMSDLGRGAKDWVEDLYNMEKGDIPIPDRMPEKVEKYFKRGNIWIIIIDTIFKIPGDSRRPDLIPEDIPVEVGGDEIPRGGSIDNPGSWKPDYTGDFPDGFGDDHSGTS